MEKELKYLARVIFDNCTSAFPTLVCKYYMPTVPPTKAHSIYHFVLMVFTAVLSA